MHAKKWLLVIIILFGGIAVLGSYIYGLLTQPGGANILWGGVPNSIRPIYTASMLLAASGYFAFTYFILFRLSPPETRVLERFGFGVFNVLYAAILIPSALWMPFTSLAIEHGTPGLVWAVRLILSVVGLASLALFFAIWNVKPRRPLWAHRAALIGCLFFCIQTVVLDAIVWSAFFRL